MTRRNPARKGHARSARVALAVLVVALLLLGGALAAAYGTGQGTSQSPAPVAGSQASSSASQPAGPTPNPTAGTTSGSSPTAAPRTGEATAITRAVVAYQNAHRVPRVEYLVSAIHVAPGSRDWASFSIASAPGYQNTVQGGYGIAHRGSRGWRVVGVGNAEVGCPPGPTVPSRVLAKLGLSCPRP